MSFLFSRSLKGLDDHTEKGWLYFFLTHPQPNDRQAFIKFGKTNRTILKRLSNYSILNLANIYYINIPQKELINREGAMKQIYTICKCSDNIDIWQEKGHEYLKGNLELMLKIFFYFCTADIVDVLFYKTKKHIIEQSKIESWINNLLPISNYKIIYLSEKKYHKMNPEVDNICDIDITYESESESENESESDFLSEIDERQNSSSEETNIFECNKCGKICKNNRGLGVHKKACTGNKSLVCEFCNNSFCSIYSLNVHISKCTEKKHIMNEKEKNLKNEIQSLKEQLDEVHEPIKNDKDIDIRILKLKYELESKDKQIEILTKCIEDYRELNHKLLSKLLDSK